LPPMLATQIKQSLWQSREGAASSTVDDRCPPILTHVIAESIGCNAEDILDFELQLVEAQPSAIIGICNEFVASGRLDNQGTCFMATRAFIDSLADGSLADDTSIRMVTMFDHEEVGSLSAQGAHSPFFEETFERIAAALDSEIYSLKARSFQISSDMAHAVHPNYGERHDRANRPQLQQGLVIKHNQNQRYATNSIGATLVRKFAEIAGAPVQEFCVRADSACGTTIGPITSGATGIRTVDVGPPQLSMHSCREVMACDDVGHSIRVFKAAFTNYASLAQGVEIDGPDPFWGTPGNGWGLRTSA